MGLPIEIKITIIELLMSPNERMKGLGLSRRSVVFANLTREINHSLPRFLSVNRELRRVVDTILFARLPLGAMSVHEVQHHLSLLENPLSSRLCNYPTTVSLSLASWLMPRDWEGDTTGQALCRQKGRQKDETTASILKLLTNLSQIELDILPFNPLGRFIKWQWWDETIAALEEIARAADGVSRPFIRALALHAIRPALDEIMAHMLGALVPNLNALVLATDSGYTYNAKDVDFVASWTAIRLRATNLATLVVSGVPVLTAIEPWACSQSLRSLDITSAPGLTPTLAHALICQFPALRSVTLRSIRLRFGSTFPPRDGPGVSPGTKMLPDLGGLRISPATTLAESSVDANANTLTCPWNPPISLQTLSLSSLDIDFVAGLSSLGTATLHLQVIHRSTTLLHLLKRPNTFVGLCRLVVGNEDRMTRGVFGWLGPEQTEELRAICKERGCTFEDERFS